MKDSLLIVSIVISIVISMLVLFYTYAWIPEPRIQRERGWSLSSLGTRKYEEPAEF